MAQPSTSFEEIIVEPLRPVAEPVNEAAWTDRLKNTIQRIRKQAKKNGELRDVTHKKIEAVRNHCPSEGNFCMAEWEENGKYKRCFQIHRLFNKEKVFKATQTG